MSELLALSKILDKKYEEMTPLEKVIVIASASDEDLAEVAAKELEFLYELQEMEKNE